MDIKEIRDKNAYYEKIMSELKPKVNIDNILFRASSMGALMGVKGLGKTGEKKARYTYLEYKYGRRKEFTSKHTTKGTNTEEAAIKYYSEYKGINYVKNETRKENEYFTGECDIDSEEEDTIIDMKSSWDVFTQSDNSQTWDEGYEEQGRVYMALFGRSKFRLVHVLVDADDETLLKALESESYKHTDRETPEYIEAQIMVNMLCTKEAFDRWVNIRGLGGDPMTDAIISHFVEIEEQDRIKEYEFTHDGIILEKMQSRVIEARKYLKTIYN